VVVRESRRLDSSDHIKVKASEHSVSNVPVTPVNAGTWQATATISEPGYEGDSTAMFTIQPAAAQVLLSVLTQIADENPKSATVTTVPENIPVEVTYDNSEALPILLGRHTVHATVTDPNYSAVADGELWRASNPARPRPESEPCNLPFRRSAKATPFSIHRC
jgi:hypothetical protein